MTFIVPYSAEHDDDTCHHHEDKKQKLSSFLLFLFSCKWFKSQLLFGYFTPYMRRAQQKGFFHASDLPNLWPADNLNYWANRFLNASRRQWTKHRITGIFSRWALIQTLLSVYWMHFLLIFCIKILDIVLSSLSLRAIKAFAEWNELDLTKVSTAEQYKGLLHASALIGFELLSVFISIQCNFWMDRVTLRVQGSLLTCLFRRIIVPARHTKSCYNNSNDSETSSLSNNEVVTKPAQASVYTLLLIDTPAITRFLQHTIDLGLVPFTLFLTLNELTRQVGTAAVAGLIPIVSLSFIVIALETYNGFLRKDLLHARDIRIDRCHETLAEIRTLRMIGFEDLAQQDVKTARNAEMACRSKRMYIHGFSWALSESIQPIALLSVITAYVVSSIKKNNFSFKISVVLPVYWVITRFIAPLTKVSYHAHSAIECWVSLMRYQHHVFGSTEDPKEALRSDSLVDHRDLHDHRSKVPSISLPLNNKEDDQEPLLTVYRDTALKHNSICEQTNNVKPLIYAHKAIFSWDNFDDSSIEQQEIFKKSNIFRVTIPNLTVTRGQCVVLMGDPGSGKTSCILALLGEMTCLDGLVHVKKPTSHTHAKENRLKRRTNTTTSSCGYCPQSPWIPEGTVKDIILFGRVYNERRYNRIIQTCGLLQDFASWSEGDQRIVLENGTNLSGGQMHRICLARSIYDYPITCDEHIKHQLVLGSSNIINKSFSENKNDTIIYGTPTFFLDDPISSNDPIVAFSIFKNLFAGPSSVLRDAASVIVIDELSFIFYIKRMQESGLEPSVEFLPAYVSNGHLTMISLNDLSYPLVINSSLNQRSMSQSCDYIPFSECSSEIVEQQFQNETKPQPSSSSCRINKTHGLQEKSHLGAVGLSSYFWLFKKTNFILIVFILLFIIELQFMHKGISIWLVHWTAKSKNQIQPYDTFQKDSNIKIFSNTTLPSNFSSPLLGFSLPTSNLMLTPNNENGTHALSLKHHHHYLSSSDNNNTTLENNSFSSPSHVSPQISTNITAYYPSFLQKTDDVDHNKNQKDINTYDKEAVIKEKGNVKQRISSKMLLPSFDKGHYSKRIDPNSTADNMHDIKPNTSELPIIIDFPSNIYRVTSEENKHFPIFKNYDYENQWLLWVFSGICVTAIGIQFILIGLETFAALKAAVRIHQDLLHSVFCAPFWFYDSIPSGVLINRFSADVHVLDTSPLFLIAKFVSALFSIVFAVILLAVLCPWCIIAIPSVGLYIYLFIYKLYRPTNRELQRSRLLALSPLSGNLSEAESGAAIIRIMGCEKYYSEKNLFLTTNLLKVDFLRMGAQSWMQTRMKLLVLFFTLLNSVFPVILGLLGKSTIENSYFLSLLRPSKFAQAAGFASLAISYGVDLPRIIGNVVGTIADMERSMCSIERLKDFISLKHTLPDDPIKRVQHLNDMPQKRTGVCITNLEISYDSHVQQQQYHTEILLKDDDKQQSSLTTSILPTCKKDSENLALRNINGVALPGQHIGIVGRTGAGKSTLLLSLLGLVPPVKGTITIDNVSLTDITTSVLRKIIGVLPQIPVVLRGWTVRRFVDPNNEFSTKAINISIEKIGLLPFVKRLPEGLNTVIIQEGYEDATMQNNTLLKKRQENHNEHTNFIITKDSLTEKSISNHTAEHPSRWLSDSQLRMLTLARLSLNSRHYRLVLVDEPPIKQISSSKDESIHLLSSTCPNIPQLLNDLFPTSTVITVAHHAASIQGCDAVWVLSKGELVAQVSVSKDQNVPSSQEELTELISKYEQQS